MIGEVSTDIPSGRGRHLLKVLIQRYIRDGHPVGSRTLSRDSGLDLSPATIRNVMSDLEDMGLVSAPHVSAGRVPTPQGYRLFVDTLVRYRQPGNNDIQRIRQKLKGEYDSPGDLISTVSSMLSEFTSMAGVVSVPRAPQTCLRQIEFLPLSENRVLVILVINDTEVQNRILHTDRDYSADELQQAQNYINRHYAGTDLHTVRGKLLEDLEETRDSMNRAMHDIIAVAHSAMGKAENPDEEYVLAGETNLMDFAELSDVDKLRQLFDAFSHKQLILDLLDRSINANGV
ncbi:MAG: heat-inducible transcriptional repressor HrcA, partial [Proteobacteria bacterium]|nr:heat-inducible transcriptional repressor HrcA [Pseudomonadota bacterium]